MILNKKISLLFICVAFINPSFGQEKVVPVEEVEEIEILGDEQEYEPGYDASVKKKTPEKLPFAFNTFRYEFKTNGNEVQYITIKNRAKEAEKAIEVIPVDKMEDLDIVSYNFGYEYHKTKSHKNDIERHYHENYIIYRNRKKYGLVLKTNVIPAKFDSIGKPYLVRGENPMMLVAKKKRGKYVWGIVKSDGSFLLPVEYDEIIIPVEMDVTMNSSGSNKKDTEGTWSNLHSELFTDGLYHNQKIIVRKKNKYGLYSANGEQELEPKYDNIEVDDSYGVYTLQKGDESGFLIAEYKKIGVWGINKLTEKNTRVNKYIRIFPIKDYQIFIKDKQVYIKYNSGIVRKINHHTLEKMIEE